MMINDLRGPAAATVLSVGEESSDVGVYWGLERRR